MNLTWPPTHPVLTGPRFSLRPWRTSDAQAVFDACQDEATQHFTTIPVPYLMSDAQQFIALAPLKWTERSEAQFAIVDLDDDVVGSIGMMKIDDEQRSAEAGYWIAPQARQQGAARDALELLTTWGREVLGLREVILLIERENTASIAVAMAAGFRRFGEDEPYELKGSVRHMGRYH